MADVNTRLDWFGKEAKIKGKKVVNKTAFETGIIIQGYAVSFAPVDSGRLRGSIVTRSITQDNGSPQNAEDLIQKPTDEGTVFVGTNVEYAEYVEFGTRYQAAQPYLRPAFDLAQGKTVTIGIKNGRAEFEL